MECKYIRPILASISLCIGVLAMISMVIFAGGYIGIELPVTLYVLQIAFGVSPFIYTKYKNNERDRMLAEYEKYRDDAFYDTIRESHIANKLIKDIKNKRMERSKEKVTLYEAMELIDDYLNAGGKTQRTKVHIKARTLYEKYNKKNYINREDR